MIKIQFQALDNYEKKEEDVQLLNSTLQAFIKKYPKLFSEEEVVIDVKVSTNSGTLKKTISLIGYIPKYGKIVATAEEQTFPQAVSAMKSDLDRKCRELTDQS